MKRSTYLMLGATALCVIATAVFLFAGIASQDIDIYVMAKDHRASETASRDTIAIPEESVALDTIPTDTPGVKLVVNGPSSDKTPAPAEPSAPTSSPSPSPTVQEAANLTVAKPAPAPKAAVNVVAFAENRPDYRFRIGGFKGYGVRESATVSSPVLIADEEWARAVKMTLNMHTLRVEVDIKRLTDSYGAYFQARNICPVTVVVPKGWLRGASLGTRTLYLDSIRADKFIAVSADRITLTQCKFGELECAGRRLNELKLVDTTVGVADIRVVSPSFLITGTSQASGVARMNIRSVSTGNDARISIRGLRIDELRWDEPDNETNVTVTSKDPVNFKRR